MSEDEPRAMDGSASAAVPPVAVLGLGSMGSRMAARLAAAGAPLAAWNRSEARLGPLRDQGVRIAASPAEAAASAEVVVLALTDDAAVREVMVGDDGVLAGARAGTVVVDTSTVHPATAVAMAEVAAARAVRFVDAPVSGGIEGAANGTLTLFCGGTAEAIAQARPVLEHLARRIEHLGPSGAGQITKAVNQVVLAGTFLGVAEGVAMAEAAGLDAATVVAAIEQGAAASWVLSNRAPNMVRRDFPPAGRLALHLKDLGIAIALSRDAGQLLPVATLVAGIEQALAAAGYGDDDVSSVIRFLRPDGP
jgi:3-hydroxyisobutyrate dehydrogenase-like beta-hydroxyacid dehydrogenase